MNINVGLVVVKYVEMLDFFEWVWNYENKIDFIVFGDEMCGVSNVGVVDCVMDFVVGNDGVWWSLRICLGIVYF